MARGLHQDLPPSNLLPIMSSRNSWMLSPCVNPLAQLLPAPPPSLEIRIFSGLKRLFRSPFWMPMITLNRGGEVRVQEAIQIPIVDAFDHSETGEKGKRKLRGKTGKEASWSSPRLEVKEQCSWDVMIVICLVEEYVLAVAALWDMGTGRTIIMAWHIWNGTG